MQVAAHAAAALLVAGWLLHVHVFLQLSIQKCRLDVQLVQVQVLRCRHSQQGAQGGVLAHRCKDFLVVNALALLEALGHQPRLVALDVAVGVTLDLEHPLHGDGVDARWSLLQGPGVVGQKGCHLLVHGLPPHVGIC